MRHRRFNLKMRPAVRALVYTMVIGSLLLVGGPRAEVEATPRLLADAPPWSPNVNINDDFATPSHQASPAIAVDPSGNAYAVWMDRRSGYDDIYFAYRPAGGSWGANIKVSDDTGTASQMHPCIAVDPSGNTYAVWEDKRDGNWDIYFSYRPAGGSWGGNVKVNDDTGTSRQFRPCIAVDPNGNAYTVWEDNRNSGPYWYHPDIYFSYRPAGGSWGTNVKVDDDTTGADQGAPSIAVDGSGNSYAVWSDERNGDSDVYFSYRPAGGSWGTNVRVDDDPGTGFTGSTSIAVDASGNAYAVWTDGRGGANPDIYFSYRPAGGSWGTNVRVDDDTGTAVQQSPSIAVDPSGNAYAAWSDKRIPGDENIHLSHRPAAGSWGSSIRVNDDVGTLEEQGDPSIAVDSSGNGYAVWYDHRKPDPDIYFSSNRWTSMMYVPLVLRKHQ